MSTFKRRLAMLVPGLLVVLGDWQFVWGGRQKDSAAAGEATQTTHDQASSIQSQVRSAEAFRTSGKSGVARLNELRNLLPADAGIAEFILVHDQLTTRWGVTVSSLTPEAVNGKSDPDTPAGLGSNTISLQVQGPQDAVINYLVHLHELPRALSIENVAMANEGESLVSLSLRIKVYSANAGKAPAQAKGAGATATIGG